MSQITLARTTPSALTLTLPSGLLWVDQYGWQEVVQSSEYSAEGALVLDLWKKQSGRPIQLQGEQDRAWCERGLLATLRTWASEPGLQMTLTHAGVTYQVAFDHESKPIEASPLTDFLGGGSGEAAYTVRNEVGEITTDVSVNYFDPQATDPFAVVLRFLVLSA
jgi:hypothetical protein